MAVLAKPTKYATKIKGESLTEQEHKDSCDINLMMRSINRGQMVRGKAHGDWVDGKSFDDMNMDGLTHRIRKDRIERELEKQFRETEFSAEEAEAIPPSVKKKYGDKIRIKKAQKNNELNDENAQHNNSEKTPQKNSSQQTGGNKVDGRKASDSAQGTSHTNGE